MNVGFEGVAAAATHSESIATSESDPKRTSRSGHPPALVAETILGLQPATPECKKLRSIPGGFARIGCNL